MLSLQTESSQVQGTLRRTERPTSVAGMIGKRLVPHTTCTERTPGVHRHKKQKRVDGTGPACAPSIIPAYINRSVEKKIQKHLYRPNVDRTSRMPRGRERRQPQTPRPTLPKVNVDIVPVDIPVKPAQISYPDPPSKDDSKTPAVTKRKCKTKVRQQTPGGRAPF